MLRREKRVKRVVEAASVGERGTKPGRSKRKSMKKVKSAAIMLGTDAEEEEADGEIAKSAALIDEDEDCCILDDVSSKL